MSGGAIGPAGEQASEVQGAMFDDYVAGKLSAHMTLMYWLQRDPRVDVIDAALHERLSRDLPASERTACLALAKLLSDNRAGCERIATMLRSGMDTDATASTVDAGLEFSRRLFDWSVNQNPEASVALYSLGNPQILAAATAEIATELVRMGVTTSTCDVLDVGCGTGRVEYALAATVKSITGVDLSTEMVTAARVRCAGLGNVQVQQCNGRDLRDFGDASFDLVLAVDSFPYIVQSGGDLAALQFTEAHRVLKPRGSFLILEYSYRGDVEQDRADVALLADRTGFAVRALGERPFLIWDGAMYHLQRR